MSWTSTQALLATTIFTFGFCLYSFNLGTLFKAACAQIVLYLVTLTVQEVRGGDLYGSFHIPFNMLPGSDPNSHPDTEWLNMGYWKHTQTFPLACEALALRLIRAANCTPGGRVLDVGHACGDSLLLQLSQPKIPRPISLTGVTNLPFHHTRSRDRIAKLKSSHPQTSSCEVTLYCGDVIFRSQDANHPLNPLSSTPPFSSILALDCAYHFASREIFLRQSFTRLSPGGTIALADLAVSHPLPFVIGTVLSKVLSVRSENMITPQIYEAQLRTIGYSKIHVENITDDVFPGFRKFLRSRGGLWVVFELVIGWWVSVGGRFLIVNNAKMIVRSRVHPGSAEVEDAPSCESNIGLKRVEGDYYDHTKTLNENGSLDLSETPECALCHKQDPKCMLCAACKAVFYCSTECARAGWTDRIIEQGGGTAPGHKIMCQQNNEQMSKVTDVQDVLLQFPWARIEKDGTFIPALVLASKNILGTGKEYGFWSREPCCDEHGLSSYEVGTTLLQEAHPNEQTGWKLPDEEIPRLAFDEQHKPPRAPPKFEASWKSYYGWRGLPLSSPVALLLHWPLTIYQLLKKLEVISDAQEMPGGRRKLLVHYIGVEEELDYLPIFGELALLLPNTDIELVLFGEPAYMILHSAPQVAESATIISKSNDDIVYTYSAPVESGSGTIRIVLWGGGPIWTPEVLRFGAPVPDAIVGLNAGLASYQEWQSVIVSSRAFNIPFAITDLMEASLDLNRRLIRGITVDLPDDEDAEEWMKHTYGEKASMNLRKDHDMLSEMNAFMKPGQRIGGPWSRLPAAVNGFTFIVTPKLASGPDSV